jgi:hypothetical protein
VFGFLKRWILRRELKRVFERLEKGGHLSFIKAFFGGSKKATAVLAGVLLVVFRQALGLDEQTASELVKLIMSYVGAQGVVDLALAFSGAKEK